MKRHYVVVTESGQSHLHPLKRWFAEHLREEVRPGMTSHQMRSHLRRLGWRMDETETEILLVQPDDIAALAYANEAIAEAEISVEIEQAAETLFAYESHLRDFIAKHLDALPGFPEKLHLHPNGVEFRTDVGFIDLLAVGASGDFYVFELKLGRGPDAAPGQILRYMGWIDHHLAADRKVHGVIVAAEISDKLRYAASQVSSVHLLEYQLQFDLRPARPI